MIYVQTRIVTLYWVLLARGSEGAPFILLSPSVSPSHVIVEIVSVGDVMGYGSRANERRFIGELKIFFKGNL